MDPAAFSGETMSGLVATTYMDSSIPVASDFDNGRFHAFCAAIRHPVMRHRKLWEFAFIYEVLQSAGMLVPGSRGLCFGSGKEPLPALFASAGCTVLATDAPPEVTVGAWAETNQHASGLGDLFRPDLIDETTFGERVSFAFCDMNAIGADLRGFDFCWSACCLEHLGSLRHGLDFIRASLDTLRPGGFACHTTEFNLSSDTDTLETQGLSLYRRSDILGLVADLTAQGHEVRPIVIRPEASPVDNYVDLPPFGGGPHLKIMAERYVTTSIGLLVRRKGAARPSSGWHRLTARLSGR